MGQEATESKAKRVVTLRIPGEVHAALKQSAHAAHTSSNLRLAALLIRGLVGEGLLPDVEKTLADNPKTAEASPLVKFYDATFNGPGG